MFAMALVRVSALGPFEIREKPIGERQERSIKPLIADDNG
jgi:hypothetical protein